MTEERAVVVLEGLAKKHKKLEEQAGSDFAEIHGEIAQALDKAICKLKGLSREKVKRGGDGG